MLSPPDHVDSDSIRAFSRQVNFGRVAERYAKHLAGYPKSLPARLKQHGVGIARQEVLDLGTGPGTLAKNLAALGCVLTGVDPSEEMLEIARLTSANLPVNVRKGWAEDLEFADARFDCVVAGQAWHLFNRSDAASESFRVLKAGGVVAITHFEWITLPGNVADITEQVIRKYNPDFALGGHGAIYPQWLPDIISAGFTAIETFSFDEPMSFDHASWRQRIQASAAGIASLTSEKAALLDDDLAQVLASSFPSMTLSVPHRSWTLVARKPPTG